MKKQYTTNDIRATFTSILERYRDHSIDKDEALEIFVEELSGSLEDIHEILNDLVEVARNW